MSIWTGKNGYNSKSDFAERTEKALTKDKVLFGKDGGAHKVDDKAVNWILKQIENLYLNNKNFLEIGCGYGRWAETLKGKYKTYTGVDITSDRINYAKKTYSHLKNVEFINIEENWDLNKKFDVILSLMVIQHLNMKDTINLLNCMLKHMNHQTVVLLHEGRLGYFTEEEAEQLYLSKDCPYHMIYKPISVLEQQIPKLKWKHLDGLHYMITLK